MQDYYWFAAMRVFVWFNVAVLWGCFVYAACAYLATNAFVWWALAIVDFVLSSAFTLAARNEGF